MLKQIDNRKTPRAHLSLVICVCSFFLSVFSTRAQTTSLNVTDFGATGDAVQFSVNTVSNSTVVSVAGTNIFSSSDVGKVIEVFRAGPWMTYSNWGVIVTQQDIVCLITNVSDGTNLSLSIPCGWTMTASCIVGTNNAPAFQSAINQASSLVASGQDTNVTINIPAGTFLMMSSNVLDPNYVMGSISDTHPALIISSGGITLLGDPSGNTVLMSCGAGMEHLVAPGLPLDWISPAYAPYEPMRDTLVECRGPVVKNQYPLVFQNLTMDGGLTNGMQDYNYWTLIQGNGEGWDTTHHAVADWDGTVSYQMNQMKVFTNCVFQHWRGEILICWTGCITNAFNDIANCVFQDGNATADNMYYGQHVHGCTFNGLGKVMEYYQGNATLPTVFENSLITNVAPNNHYVLTIVGATILATPPAFTIQGNTFHDETGINAIQFSPAANVSVISNTFVSGGGGVVFTSAGVQPSNGTQIPVMTNFNISCNSFINCGNPLSMDGYPVDWMLVSNNIGIGIVAAGGFKDHITLANNQGSQLYGGPSVNQTGVQQGHYMLDETNNVWTQLNEPLDAGDYSPTNLISYGNGIVHMLRASGSVFYLDDTHPDLFPTNGGPIEIQVYAADWSGMSVTNFYMSATKSVSPVTITNGAPPTTFFWNGSKWEYNPTLQYTVSASATSPGASVQFKSPGSDSDGTAITTWLWNFGDGITSTNQNPTHSYDGLGSFHVTLIVSDEIGLSPDASGPSISVVNPTLQFTVSKTNGVSRFTAAFKAPSVDSVGTKIKSWHWNFDDGSSGTGQNVSHVYTNALTFHPSLIVSNALGFSPSCSGPLVTVTNPIIKFTISKTNLCPLLVAEFKAPTTDSGGNKITTWYWAYGDGTVGTTPNPTHAYASVGTYHPTLNVVNQYGVHSMIYSGPAVSVSNPTIQFTQSKNSGVSRLAISFKCPSTDSAGVAIKGWHWTFGDYQQQRPGKSHSYLYES